MWQAMGELPLGAVHQSVALIKKAWTICLAKEDEWQWK